MAALDGEYEPSTFEWVRNQVEEYEASGGTRANTLRDTGIPIIVVTMVGAKSGKVRKIALMRVEHDGDERATWWERGAKEFPNYAQYQDRTERRIPVFIARRR